MASKLRLQQMASSVLLTGVVAFGWPMAPASAQPAAAPSAVEAKAAETSQKAAKLEADLGKLRDTSPEAAELMLELIDLYHANGRVFGLISMGERFVANQPSHPKQKDVMLKLIDGLLVTSRNKETVSQCRQFLSRNPDDPAAAQVEVTLARVLDQMNDLPRSAEAHAAIWTRQGDTPQGRGSLSRAVNLYSQMNNKDGITKAAELCESAVDRLPANPAAAEFGARGVYERRRNSEWVKSNLIANKMLQKKVPLAPQSQRDLYLSMAENYANLGQRVNAIESLKKARAITDTPDVLARMISEMHNAQLPVTDIEPLVNEFLQKYPTRSDRFTLKSYVGYALLRSKDKDKGLAYLGELLNDDGMHASAYVQQSPADAAALPQVEKTLLKAISQNKTHGTYLRYVTGFELYRDRIKDAAKAKQTLKELVLQFPSNDGHTSNALSWLLHNSADDAEFQDLVQQHLKVRTERLYWTSHRDFLNAWIREVVQNKTAAKELKARAQWAKARLDEANDQPFVKTWFASEDTKKEGVATRVQLLSPEGLKTLTDPQAYDVFTRHVTPMYNAPTAAVRTASIPFYAAMATRFPKDVNVAYTFLYMAYNYGNGEQCKQAVAHRLTQEPTAANLNGNEWSYMIAGADRANDPQLVKAAFDWIVKSQEKFGYNNAASYSIGDILEKHKFAAEALAVWKKGFESYRENYDSRACAERLATRLMGPEKRAFLESLMKTPSVYLGTYSGWLGDEQLKAGELDAFEKTLQAATELRKDRPLSGVQFEEYPAQYWVDNTRANKDMPVPQKARIWTAVRELRIGRPSGAAAVALLELGAQPNESPMQRLLAYQSATMMVGDDSNDWDRLMPYAQAALGQKDYLAAATLLTGMLSNIPQVDGTRKQAARDMVTQSYTRMGGVGLAIDETSPIAPLLQAALYLRLGDERLAFDTYLGNQKLFDQHRADVPVDLLLFVCDSHMAAGGDANHNRVEDILQAWVVKNADSQGFDAATKASVQLMLGKNYFKSQRYEVSRTEFNTLVNRYPNTKQAVEAEFGIGESFMAQKVYDQAEAVFEKLANSRDRDIVIRAEFLRGVLAHRRGDRDEARGIFKAVLERVPSIELANQALFNLSEVYGAEQRYLDQLELLRTIGRLGRNSKRSHAPGESLSIVVQDSDLGVSRGHSRIPVKVTTVPGGDEETIFLYSGGAGKGLFRADLETALGQVKKGDKILQLTGKDTIKVDYPEEFKQEFKHVQLSDVEIRIAANAKFEASSSKIIDKDKESLSDRLEREAKEADAADKRVSQGRPINQIKPGNMIYLRVLDADRDLSDEADTVNVKLVATSGDQVHVPLKETGPHTGVFEGTAKSSDLPAGALASDTAIQHSPLMAIDQNTDTKWLSEPDGATPKWLSVDMKDVRDVARLSISTPNPAHQAPVRGEILGSDDGRFWFRLASHPPVAPLPNVDGEFGRMTRKVFAGVHYNVTTWAEVVQMSKGKQAIEAEDVDELSWGVAPDADHAKSPHAVLWQGKLVQPRSGAARFSVQGTKTALMIDGRLELPVGPGNRTCDVYLEAGTHDLTIFAATTQAQVPVSATWVRSNHRVKTLTLAPFRRVDFDLDQPVAKPAKLRAPGKVTIADGVWNVQFPPVELRHVKFVVHEYIGEAVAVNHMEVGGPDADELYIPTKADVLALANNDVLEIAAGDQIKATYADEFTQTGAGGNQLLSTTLLATYFDASTTPITYDFERAGNGAVTKIRKELIRIDPGERFVVEVTDYDMDQTDKPDEITIQVSVNDGAPIELIATETEPYSGIFTKEVDTSAKEEKGKLHVKPGDQIYCAYVDAQNTFPGHSVPRESVVYVNQPTEARIRIVETRFVMPPATMKQPPRMVYLPANEKKKTAGVAFEAPLTVEVYDRDAAKDSRSKILVQLTTTDGATAEVECVISSAFTGATVTGAAAQGASQSALEEGRFIGQIVMQLGSKSSPEIVPLGTNMPRNLIGQGTLPEEMKSKQGEALVTRVLNLSGKDRIIASYKDNLRPKGGAQELKSEGRLIANGSMQVMDREYKGSVAQLHVGERMFLMVTDADLDISDERDKAKVEISTENGEKETVELEETLSHSGVFTGSVALRPSEKPTAGNLKTDDPAIETYFGDTVKLTYVDGTASTESGTLESSVELPVVVGTDGLVLAFSKTFQDEKLAVETKFHIAESYFELFKSHKSLGRTEEAKSDLESGRRLLREVLEDYPNPKYVPRISYLRGQFAQELQQWDEAIESYRMIVRQYQDHPLAPDAQYKMAQCYEEAGRFDDALEAYVTLAATFPQSPLIANVMIRISDRFYRDKNYDVAAQVGEKFLEKYESHQYAPRMAFRIGQCYYKAEEFGKAGKAFDRFAKIFPDDQLCADALFWAGESYRMGKSDREAFRRYNKCRWDYPASDAAKYARGRLALPNMLAIFEAEANSVEDQ